MLVWGYVGFQVCLLVIWVCVYAVFVCVLGIWFVISCLAVVFRLVVCCCTGVFYICSRVLFDYVFWVIVLVGCCG